MESFIAEMTQPMPMLARQVSTWATTEARTLEELEQITLKTIKDLGSSLLSGLCQLLPPPLRPRTLLVRVAVPRAIHGCVLRR